MRKRRGEFRRGGEKIRDLKRIARYERWERREDR